MSLTRDEEDFLRILRENRNHRGNTAKAMEEHTRSHWDDRKVRRWIKKLREAGKVNADEVLPISPGVGRVVTQVKTVSDADGNVKTVTTTEKPDGSDDDIVDVSQKRVGKVTREVSREGWARDWIRYEENDPKVQAIRDVCEKLETLAPFPPVDRSRVTMTTSLNRLCNLIVLSDAHIGALAWHREGGGNWDIKIAQDMLCRTFDAMIAQAPNAGRCIVVLLGDWMHYDGLLSITPTSGNIVDADGRPAKMVDVAIDVAMYLVQRALEAYENVDLLVAEGNHDLYGTVWLRKMFRRLYASEPRLNVVDDERPYYGIQHGNVALFFHHGHMKTVKNTADLLLVFAQEHGALWSCNGNDTKRYVHTGHLHHLMEKGKDGSKGPVVKQHPTIMARESHSSRHGYQSERAAICTSYHNQYGRVAETIVTPEMLAEAV